ncbi:cell division protein PerM [Nocardioides bizhenqiangii]|uniref:DUF6350 family protein n=1 Tax=Nocardioides bizhenqiangii TaxID=3095076 RepID=A0ABZ0ZPC0_9ACTN|nr:MULTISPECIES: DUF6350 family protein [unclassified Nocardioides]MDZ5621494.1 DUF6350 family protein [Nocardioides sp. HM23]WQQ25669.1 DUF6350 family protein [Nocardioides sp. HM61]
MTSLQSPSARTTTRREPRRESELRQALGTRRPLVPTATLGGALAAAGPLLVCMAVAVVGWFLTDAGGHGTPSGALRVGALSWLAAHGSGVSIEGVRITAMPLGITLLCVWSAWRVGHRVGESISGHGPDADRIADGERDWTVPFAGGLFTVGYVLVGVLATTLASTIETMPSTGRVVLWSTLIAAGAGLPALARGSGRAAIWLPATPVAVRDTAVLVRAILRAWLAVALAALLVALVLDFSTAANIVSQLESDAGDIAMLSVLTLALLPNAALFSSAYLFGPGFTVGTGTLVSPGAVVLGPLPLFPLLAALPDGGPTPGWAGWLMVSPVLVAGLASALAHRSRPAVAWDQAAIRGCGGGLVAGLVLGLLTSLAGGAVGPGRMADVGPLQVDVLLHAMTGFGIGGLLGALAMTWWQRRGGDLARRGLRRIRPSR